MATFAKATFNTAKYAAARPTYPSQVFQFIFDYHEQRAGSGKARWNTAVDLGCGTAQAAAALSPFKRVIGVDPSAKMIEGAIRHIQSLGPETGQFEFVQSPAETLPFIEDDSVDMVVSAQAAHWFDWHRLWPELARILRKDGSVAFWGYSQLRLTGYPTLTPLIHEYSQGVNPKTSLGPYWEQPGRRILDNHLLDLPKADEVLPGRFKEVEYVYFTGDHYPQLPSPRPVILRKTVSWDGFEGYLRTFSSLHNFQEHNPEDLQNPEGDIADRFIAKLKSEIEKLQQHEQHDIKENEVQIEWPMALVMAKKA